MNKVSSAIKLEHLATGITVSMRDEKSQHKNRAKARRVMMSRVYEHIASQQQQEIEADRRSMVGSGDRSDRIRTYNFPQDRCTDHRINKDAFGLQRILTNGEFDDFLEDLHNWDLKRLARESLTPRKNRSPSTPEIPHSGEENRAQALHCEESGLYSYYIRAEVNSLAKGDPGLGDEELPAASLPPEAPWPLQQAARSRRRCHVVELSLGCYRYGHRPPDGSAGRCSLTRTDHASPKRNAWGSAGPSGRALFEQRRTRRRLPRAAYVLLAAPFSLALRVGE